MAATLPPDDVILQILPNLPLKSLLRFKSVSKTWYSTISDPQFSAKLPWMRPSVLFCQNSLQFSTMTVESLLTEGGRDRSLNNPPLPLPWTTEPGDRNYFIGSCNGVVCVDRRSSGGGEENLILWIPSTRKFRKLPPRPSCYRVAVKLNYSYYVRFGYDESIHDYKLVWLDYHVVGPSETRLHVFTLKSNTWRRTDRCMVSEGRQLVLKEGDIRNPNNPRVLGVLSNGAVHWRTGAHHGQNVILALDLAAESFQVLDFGYYPFGGGGGCLVGGCSCMYDAGLGMSLQIVREYGCREIRKYYPIRKYYQILFSSEKEVLSVFDARCQNHTHINYDDKIIKFRIEEGGEKVSSPETVLCVPNTSEGGSVMPGTDKCRNNIVMHMEESLVSLTYYQFGDNSSGNEVEGRANEVEGRARSEVGVPLSPDHNQPMDKKRKRI